jgi:hypothetical protein
MHVAVSSLRRAQRIVGRLTTRQLLLEAFLAGIISDTS